MSKFNQDLQSNNLTLQEILNTVNALPEAGVQLPALENEGAAADILSGKQFINQEGEIVEGTMPNNGAISQTIDGINTTSVTIPSGYTQGGSVSLDNTISNEVTTQTDLIAQIAAAVDGLPEAGESGGTIETCTLLIDKGDFSTSDTIGYATYHTYENNTICCTALTKITDIPETITNFISGSVITIYLSNMNYAFTPQNNCKMMMTGNEFKVIKVTATTGETASIYVQYNDL